MCARVDFGKVALGVKYIEMGRNIITEAMDEAAKNAKLPEVVKEVFTAEQAERIKKHGY